MKEDKEEYSNYSIMSDNNLTNNPTFIDLRLNTAGILKDLENFLSAKRIILEPIYDDDGNCIDMKQKEKKMGKALANEEGITALLNMVLLRSHHHCIQGNMDREHYWNNIVKTRKEIASDIVMNCYDWGISDNKLKFIIDTIVDYIEKVTTRLIDNKERESYMQQFMSKEQIVNSPKRNGALSSFTGGMKSAN